MHTMNISLPDPLKEFIDRQVASGRYASASEYIGDLVQHAELEAARDHLEALLIEGMESPKSDFTSEDLDEIRRDAIARLEERRAG